MPFVPFVWPLLCRLRWLCPLAWAFILAIRSAVRLTTCSSFQMYRTLSTCMVASAQREKLGNFFRPSLTLSGRMSPLERA